MFETVLISLGLAALAGVGAWLAGLRRAVDPQRKLPFPSPVNRRPAVDDPPAVPGPSFGLPDSFLAPVAVPLPPLPRSATRTQFDAMILQVANEFIIAPHVLKAIVKKESSFSPDALNPEGVPFTLNGVRYDPSQPGWSQGIRELRTWIKRGNDPATLGLNPSIGLAQVRVRIAQARSITPNVRETAKDLFDPLTNLRAAASLLQELFRAGITIDTIDAYNVGQDLKPRNLPYRDFVKQWAATYEGDF